MKKQQNKMTGGSRASSVSKLSSAALGVFLATVAAAPLTANAASITAAGVDSTSVQNAINAAADGDTVLVPAGSASWSGVSISKGIRLIGAGVDQTTITLPGGGQLISLSPNGKYMQVSGFTFNDNSSVDHYSGLIGVSGGGNWRICSNKFNIYYFAITVANADAAAGLIDRNQCYQLAANGSANFYSLIGRTTAWDSGPSYGTTNILYIEHNQVGYINSGNGVGDTYNGAKYVFRYNMVTNTWMDNHGADSGGYRAPHSMEIYGNTFVYNSSLYAGIIMRGGTALIFSNTVIGNMTGILLQNFRYGGGSSICSSQLGGCGPWGVMTGSNPYDGNTRSDGYPGLDQIGMTGPTTLSGSSSTQVHFPVYCWANTAGFSPQAGGAPDQSPDIAAGRDYFTTAPPFAYTPLVDPHPLAGGVVVPPTSPAISLSASSLNFGTLPAGTSSNLTITVQNSGAGILVGTATTAAPFSLVSGGSYSLTSSQTQVVTIRYSPTIQGSSSGTVNFSGGGGASASVNGSAWAVLPGLSWAATSGVVSGYSTTNISGVNYIYQAAEVTDPVSGGQAIYGFQINSAGNYTVSATINAPNNNANSFFVNIDAQPTSPTMIWDPPVFNGFTNELVSWRGSGTDTNNQFSPKVFTLSVGPHQLIIAGREANVLLGQIAINSLSAPPPPPTNVRIVSTQ